MSKILIQTSAGELVDKLTILEIKKKKSLIQKAGDYRKEYFLKKSVKENLDLSDEINNLWAQLRKVNLKIIRDRGRYKVIWKK